MTCPQCNTSKMRLRQAKANQNLFAGCSGFPGCKNIMNVPKGISNIHMLDQNCPRCMQRDKKEVKLFDVEFSKDVVNQNMKKALNKKNNTAGTFCLNEGCDPNVQMLIEETRQVRAPSKPRNDYSSIP